MTRPLSRLLPLLLFTLLPLGAAAQSAPQEQAPQEVGVVTLEEAAVPYSVTLPGRAVASEQTEIRPRVSGMIEEIPYPSGQRVSAGDTLFRLEAASYEAALAAAEAERVGAQVAVDTAQATVDRYARLEGSAVTTSDLQTARATLAQARATLSSAEAALQSAQLDLDRVEIKSPIDGVADVPAVSVGTLVTANQTTALTTVTATDPIFIDVAESSARIMRVRARIDSGAMTVGDRLEAVLTLENGETYSGTGQLVSPGLIVSTTTGSVDLRFRFDNPDRMILPGQFLRVEVTVGTQSAVLVPQRATDRQSDGTLTAFVLRDGTARRVEIASAGTYRNAWITTGGVAAGDQVIVDGRSNLMDGAQVTPVPVTIDAAGVVQDAQAD
ncbi:efflux RND transporter periplasmic adaptor subunit [Mesobacterium pallidum]|uniref:efflux RND transporter periplasmic adaptor subunit n=1 Tax=Mesobacterium pallidum TaxID=2872037 RepID=UPI001EE1CEFA|nr:efflux RND transporter periplasmic adaptor subunit [Mesobacterium pallidum]